MKSLLSFTLLFAGCGLMQASIIENITFDLSPLHPGSALSGTFTLSNSPAAGDMVPVLLSFSDPADYAPTSLTSTITIETGTPSGFQVNFSDLSFTNLSGSVLPINTLNITLMRTAFAKCASFPCTATGLFQDRSPAVFTSTYTITPAPVPEPGYALLIPMVLTALAFRRRAHVAVS